MSRFIFNYSQLFNETLKPNTLYILNVTSTNMLPSKLLILHSYLLDFLHLGTFRICAVSLHTYVYTLTVITTKVR